MKIKEVINILEDFSPPEYSLDWDNSGLQVGNINNEAKIIGIALTPTSEIIQEAIEKECNFLITHHPLIFKSIKSINTNSPLGKSIELALKNNLTIYTMHTNFDSTSTGLNFKIAKELGLDNIGVLSVTRHIDMLKLVTFIPEEYTLKVINAISDVGAGQLGKFSHCSYITAGIATFVNEGNSEEKEDEVEVPSKEPEDRLEIAVPRNNVEKVISVLKEVHPYKDIMYDIYKLDDQAQSIGIGTIGEFYTPFSLSEVIDMVKRNLNISNLTYVGNLNKKIEKVAICTGSGASFIKTAKSKEADLYITGDIKYHDAIDAKEMDLALIDAGHYATEIIAVPFIKKFLKEKLNDPIDIVELNEENPFSFI